MTEPRRRRILLVDDDEAGRYAVAHGLRAAGFEVTEAGSGGEALRLAAERPDLVLLDVNLPDVHGFDVCRRLKSDPLTAHIPVVHLSATLADAGHVSAGLEGGADAYLTQPIDARTLAATLNAVMRLSEVEHELHEKARLLDAVVSSTADAIYVKDLEGRYLLFNPAAEAVTGRLSAEVLGRDDTLLFPPDEAAVVMEVDRRAVEAGGVSQVEEEVTGADGEVHTFLSAKGPLVDRDGRAYALFGVARDISDRKRAEDEVRRLHAELEDRVAQRTLELERSNRELVAANRRLEASNRELEAFAYAVSHDLRTPLRAIAGFTQIVAEDNAAQLDGPGKQNLARARAAALRMADIIDDLLRLSQLAQADLRREHVDLSALAREVAAELIAGEPACHIELVVADGLIAEADAELVHLLLHNLLANAVKFTSAREVAHVEVGRESTAHGDAFFVRDDGAGFDMAHAGRLFGAFERLHSPQEFPGTGIGLATVQRIAERHGGRVWAEGAVDGGATFWFTLPAASGADSDSAC